MIGCFTGKLYNYRLPFVEINYDVVPVAPIRRSLSKFLDVMQHRELGPILGTEEGDRCYHGEVLCIRTDQRGRGLGKIIGSVFTHGVQLGLPKQEIEQKIEKSLRNKNRPYTVEKTIEMARNKGAKYFDVTSVNQFTKKILEKFSFKGWYFFE